MLETVGPLSLLNSAVRELGALRECEPLPLYSARAGRLDSPVVTLAHRPAAHSHPACRIVAPEGSLPHTCFPIMMAGLLASVSEVVHSVGR